MHVASPPPRFRLLAPQHADRPPAPTPSAFLSHLEPRASPQPRPGPTQLTRVSADFTQGQGHVKFHFSSRSEMP